MSELEKKVQILVQQIAARLLEFTLNEIDVRLAKKREPGKYKNLGIRSRPIVTTVGEIEIKRRYYKDIETGESHFLLDESLGLVPRRRISPRLERMMLDMGTETTFRRASNTLEYLVPGISHMTVWNEVQRAGAIAKQEAEEKQAELFEDGVIPEGKRCVITPEPTPCRSTVPGDIVSVDQDAPLIHWKQQPEAVQECCLSTSARTNESCHDPWRATNGFTVKHWPSTKCY